jgi:hypothetical protein
MEVKRLELPVVTPEEPVEVPVKKTRAPRKLRSRAEIAENSPEIVANSPILGVKETEPEPIINSGAKKVVVTSDMTPAIVLNLIRDGADLFFESGDKFLRLHTAIVEQMPRAMKADYNRARVFNDTYRGAEDAKLTQQFVVDKEFSGNSAEKTEELTLRPGLQHRWSTPAQVNARLRLGYRVATASDAQTFLGTTGDHHEIIRDGKTELVLMVRPTSLGEKANELKAQQARQRAEQATERGLAGLGELGAKGFVDRSAKDDQEYTEIASDNMQ